jgi:hypothetical protein
MFHFYKAALVDYFMDLAIFVDSANVMKQHNVLITVVRHFLLNGSFQLSDCFFSCYYRVFFIYSISKIPSISQNTDTISFPKELCVLAFFGGKDRF